MQLDYSTYLPAMGNEYSVSNKLQSFFRRLGLSPHVFCMNKLAILKVIY